ncbi:MAG: hypothetical protein H7Y88_06585, partial [Phycisphaerales bacterium]|nr:hypothetical protein [Phycisphaerales bacterium]
MSMQSLRFRPAQRLRHAREFEAVYAMRQVRSRGALSVHGSLNGLGHS